MQDSIVAGNSAAIKPDFDAALGTDAYNIIGGTAAELDPAGLLYNGGPTPTIALWRGAAVDAGDPTFATPPS